VFQSENAFVESFVTSVSPNVWSRSAKGRVREVFESECSDGRADWVWSRTTGRWPPHWEQETAEVLQKPVCSRILTYLKRSSPRTKQFLRQRLGVAAATFDRAVRELVDVNLVRMTPNELILLTSRFHIPDIEICAFEFKLEDWQRAFFQASRYRSFANRVFVVLPESIIRRTEKKWPAFRQQNIGILSYCPDEGARRVLPSRKSPPRSKSSFYQAIGMLHEWS